MAAAAPNFYRFFGRQGALRRVHPGYEFRPGQVEMARAVAHALSEREHLLVEAGTGTGKTLAYLLPALQSGRRVLLSTGTRNLQEQLLAKDVPLLAAALGRKLQVVSLKGRQNYACRRRLAELETQPVLLDLDHLEALRRIRLWADETATGEQAELEFLPENHPVWQRVNARRETCTGSQCPRFDTCFLTQARQRASEAELVIVNHHLFFADLVLKGQDLPGVLPPYEAVVFDEAHELEDVAGAYFGVAFSNQQIEDLARDLREALSRMGSPERPAPEAALSAMADLLPRLEHLRQASQRFFAALPARDGRAAFTDRQDFRDQNADVYENLMNALGFAITGLEAIPEKTEELHRLLQRLREANAKLGYLIESEEEGVVYWLERRGRSVHLQASPIAVADLLRERLFEATDTVVLTSATLAVEGGFDYLRQRLGIRHARELVVESQFRYSEQALLYLAAHLPPPSHPSFGRLATDEIVALLQASQGRAFVLCTSHQQMAYFYQQLGERVPFPLLLQGSAPRHLLLERFRVTPNAVLIATSSFWQGVDVQGDQLSCVIIDRLPFASPGDPIVAARVAALRSQGYDPFTEYQVPEAVLALKQGLGRLIRSSRDRGVLALLDSRVCNKPYGRRFLRSLPPFTCTDRLEDAVEFFVSGSLARDHTFRAGPGYRAGEDEDFA